MINCLQRMELRRRRRLPQDLIDEEENEHRRRMQKLAPKIEAKILAHIESRNAGHSSEKG